MALSAFASWFDQPLSGQYYNEDHEAWRRALRSFVDKEISPFVEEWEEAGTFRRGLYKKAADIVCCNWATPKSTEV